jgi:hypothetical protein
VLLVGTEMLQEGMPPFGLRDIVNTVLSRACMKLCTSRSVAAGHHNDDNGAIDCGS